MMCACVCPVRVCKVKSHPSILYLRSSASDAAPDAAYAANACADVIASVAAETAATDPDHVKAHESAMAEWKLIWERILYVYSDWLDSWQGSDEPEYIEKATSGRVAHSFGHKVRASQHRVDLIRDRLVCRVCLGFSGACISAKTKFLASACASPSKFCPHSSHDMVLSRTFNSYACRRCKLQVHLKAKGLRARCKGWRQEVPPAPCDAPGSWELELVADDSPGQADAPEARAGAAAAAAAAPAVPPALPPAAAVAPNRLVRGIDDPDGSCESVSD